MVMPTRKAPVSFVQIKIKNDISNQGVYNVQVPGNAIKLSKAKGNAIQNCPNREQAQHLIGSGRLAYSCIINVSIIYATYGMKIYFVTDVDKLEQ